MRVVSDEAHLEEGVVVEAGAVIGPGVAIGAAPSSPPTPSIGANAQIGRDCFIGPCATVQAALIGNRVVIHGGAQIGREGFGFVAGPRGAERIPQIGRVVIQDDVEIGANTTVDRGALGDTVIGEGTKIDNQVQIAHNIQHRPRLPHRGQGAACPARSRSATSSSSAAASALPTM